MVRSFSRVVDCNRFIYECQQYKRSAECPSNTMDPTGGMKWNTAGIAGRTLMGRL